MASISRFCCVHMRASLCNFTAQKGPSPSLPSPLTHFSSTSNIPRRFCSGPSPPTTLDLEHHKTTPCLLSSIEEGRAVNRRQLILHTPVAVAAFAVPNALALNDVSEDVRVYTDDENKFKIEIPQEWQVGTGDGESSGFKSITAFYPTVASNSNVSVVITGLGPDFTRMESFGKVDEFAQTLVSGLDRSWRKPPGVAAKLIDCKSSNGIYYIEYSLQNPGESRRYLYSAIGMASNGWYNRLYTVTGQYVEEETDKYASKVQKVVASFRFI
ncbi:PsbP domain-containing protein 3, chloroplastic [Glycine max]|nr:PsbP domain-containing protein 3, chloroplastic [Glycine max]KAH1252148.1 PsbP domain-containing protein 3, chloroplastic [Glycine max]